MNPLAKKLENYNVILGSQSPRRKELLKGLDVTFEVKVKDTDESYPEDLPTKSVAEYIAKKKYEAFIPELSEKDFLITSDTIVVLGNEIIQKPTSVENAKELIAKLSGNTHTVVSGVCCGTKGKQISFSAESEVVFSELTNDEINYYANTYKPLDKAGAYGVQEWIGYIGIQSIKGSYYNIMGFPVQAIYTKILETNF